MLGPLVDFSIAGAAAIGLAVGFLSGLLGVGGGFLLAPLLNVFLGIPLSIVGPSDLCQIQGTSLAGLLRHRKQGQFDLRVALILLGGVFCGTEAGVRILEHLKGLGSMTLSGGTFTRCEVALSVIFTVMLVLIGVWVFLDAALAGRARSSEAGPGCERRAGLLSAIRLPPYITPAGGRPVSAVLVAYAGLLMGIPQALLGIGGGVLLLPILVYLIGLSTHAAVGTSLLVVFAGSVWGVLRHAMNFNISLPLVGALLVGSTFGSQLGAVVTTRLSAHRLRKYFSFVVGAAVLILVWKMAGMFGVVGSANSAGGH
jgi:hypothetical protein